MAENGGGKTRCYIATMFATGEAAILEAIGDYADRMKVLAELQREIFSDLYGSYVVYSYAKQRRADGRDSLVDEQREFFDFGEGQGIYDVATDTYHCSCLSIGPRQRHRRSSRKKG